MEGLNVTLLFPACGVHILTKKCKKRYFRIVITIVKEIKKIRSMFVWSGTDNNSGLNASWGRKKQGRLHLVVRRAGK